MTSITIDEMTLDVPGMSELQARRLASGIADGLAVAGVSERVGQVPTLRVDLEAAGGSDPAVLARRIVAEIVRQLSRES